MNRGLKVNDISENKPAMGAIAAVLWGALVSGTLDAADGSAYFYIVRHATPFEVLQFIASGWFGEKAFSMGLVGSLIGMVSHYAIAIVLAAIYVLAATALPVLKKLWVAFGLAYGAAIFLTMNFVVLPHTNVVDWGVTPVYIVHGLISHAILVGGSIAYFAKSSR